MASSDKKPVHILNGPNLNLLGKREVGIYGAATLADVKNLCEKTAKKLGFAIIFAQTNHEGALVEAIQDADEKAAAVILNAAALSHNSIAVLDAVRFCEPPVIETHISNIYAREPYRRRSLLSPVSAGVICGFGIYGYALALEAAAHIIKERTHSKEDAL